MPDLDNIVRKADPAAMTESSRRAPEDPRQHRLMVGSLCLLLLALGIVLWRDRDFWFPDTPEAESSQPAESSPAQAVAAPPSAVAAKSMRASPKHQVAKHQSEKLQPPDHEAANPQGASQAETSDSSSAATGPAPPMVATATRTVLPPLEVEVVAGDRHRTIHPGSNSVHVDLQPDTAPQPAPDGVASGNAETAAKITSDAAERVPMSADASDIVTSPVRPNYPMLARQMKVQGSVILQALISKDGTIQNLRVVSGPHILASAAQDAVRQWHFKPHLQGNEAVETQAKITVNFTISTN